MSWRGILTLVLLIAALITGWSAWRQRADEAPAARSDARPDYVLSDFELVSLNGDGKEAFTLRAPRLERDPRDETMALQTPLFLLPDRDGHYWEVRAKTGWISADHDEIRLRGAVEAETAPESGRVMRMNTEQLNVFPETERATSAGVVTLTQPGSTIRGSGLEVDLAENRYKFNGRTTSRYVPSRR